MAAVRKIRFVIQLYQAMKLHLPKLLLAAVCAAGVSMAATEITKNGWQYDDSELLVSSNLTYTWEDENYGFVWESDGGTLSGSGSLSATEYQGLEIEISGQGKDSSTFVIEKGVTIKNAYTWVSNATLKLKNTWHNAYLEVGSDALVDLTETKFTGHATYALSDGGTIKCPTLEISGKGSELAVYADGYENDSYAGIRGEAGGTVDGNLVLNGGGVIGSREWNIKKEYFTLLPSLVSFEHEKDAGELMAYYGTITITGTLSVKSATSIVFWSFDDYYEPGEDDPEEGIEYFRSEYVIPADDHELFICSGVSEKSLSLMKPHVARDDYWESEDDVGGWQYTKLLDDYAFYAVTGGDGMVYIYLGKEGKGSGSPIPEGAIQIGEGETVVLGGTEETTPGPDAPVYIQGGTADATGLGNDVLNNQVIMGAGGTLVTSGSQSMNLSGKGSVNYSIVGPAAQEPGANLDINATGELALKGTKYDTAKVDIHSGVLSVSTKTTLGMGADKTDVAVQSGASLTNFGTVAGDIDLAGNSTMLNQGKVEGDIVLQSKSTMVNNSTVTGDITVNSGALLSGSGSAENVLLKSGAALNVGNSPGWQKYKSVTIERGSQLTFTVDGTTAATATNHGAGTHSVLETETLTIGDGADTVKVTVNVTMGIVTAGAAPFDVELMEAGTTNATAGDFSITLNDNSLLEEGAAVSWDAATKSLTLSGTVNKAALAALMDSNAANVANTMWASANAVQEFARTAESLFLVGMPGQTTFWGGALGSFMDISGDAGFTSNLGGYAVGLQHAFTESFRAGFAFGQSFGSFKSDDDQLKADQTALMPALTAQYVTPLSKESSLSISGHIAYGTVENEADTYQAATTGKAEWDDKVLNIGVRAAWNSQIGANETVSIFTGLTYQNVEQDSFTEEFTGGERDYRSGSMSCLSLPIGATWRGIYQMEGTNVFVPEVTVAYIGDIVRDNPEVKTSVMGISREGKGTNIGRSAFMLNAGANWMFDSTWSMGAFYTLEARSHQLNQSLNASLRYSF